MRRKTPLPNPFHFRFEATILWTQFLSTRPSSTSTFSSITLLSILQVSSSMVVMTSFGRHTLHSRSSSVGSVSSQNIPFATLRSQLPCHDVTRKGGGTSLSKAEQSTTDFANGRNEEGEKSARGIPSLFTPSQVPLHTYTHTRTTSIRRSCERQTGRNVRHREFSYFNTVTQPLFKLPR